MTELEKILRPALLEGVFKVATSGQPHRHDWSEGEDGSIKPVPTETCTGRLWPRPDGAHWQTEKDGNVVTMKLEQTCLCSANPSSTTIVAACRYEVGDNYPVGKKG